MQQFLIHQQMNVISFIVLLLFFMYAIGVLDKATKINQLYLSSLSINLILIALEIVCYIVCNMIDMPTFCTVVDGFSLVLSPVLPYLFLQFVCLYFPIRFKIKRPLAIILKFLLILNAIIAVIYYFYFGENDKLPKVMVPFLISFIYLAYSFYIIIICKKMLINFEYVIINTIALITITLIMIQFIINETRFIWITSGFTMILIFIVIQQRELYRDSLTGARNRLALKKCITEFLKRPNVKLSAVMIDLDYFKNINDSFGHQEGDYALKVFVKMLQKVYLSKGVVIRMGGDEFLVLINNASQEEIDSMNKRMSKLIDKYNNKGLKPYRIKYSYATGNFDNDNMSFEQFIHKIDLEMFKNKKGRRSSSTGSEDKIFDINLFNKS